MAASYVLQAQVFWENKHEEYQATKGEESEKKLEKWLKCLDLGEYAKDLLGSSHCK